MTEQECIADYVALRERDTILDLAELRRESGAFWSEAVTAYCERIIASHPPPLRDPMREMTQRVVAQAASAAMRAAH